MQFKDLIPWGRRETSSATTPEASPMLALQQDLNRVFDEYWNRFTSLAPNGFPKTDMCDKEDEIEVTMDLPGLDENDIDVSVTEDTLTIKSERRSETEEKRKDFYLHERTYGSFVRTVPLPMGVQTDKAKAEFRKGVLTVTLPKAPGTTSRSKRIQVKNH